ncbi:MAG TPA: hypothetical protein VMD29_08065 [Terracidiphilus sp.]|nr:hypothetical protein [Terracidiphilus sp.]
MSIGQWHKHWRITALGAVLCLLAAAFAMEAKLGWFSSNSHIRVEFSATKLQPADAPEQIVQALATPAPVPHFPVQVQILLAFALVVLAISVPSFAVAPLAPAWSSFFFPQHFFRPPPRS